MNDKRRKIKGRSSNERFVGLPKVLVNSPNYKALSANAVKLLIDIAQQLNGFNNGDFSVAWTLMKERGWKSRDTLWRAQQELLHYGMIEKTRQGGKRKCNLFAVTWRPIDDCKGKLDMGGTKVASGAWKHPVEVPFKLLKKKNELPALRVTQTRWACH